MINISEFTILNKSCEDTLKQVINSTKDSSWVITSDMPKLNNENLLTLEQYGLVKNRGNILNTMITNKGRTYFEMKDIQLKNDHRINIKYQIYVRLICYIAGIISGWLGTIFVLSIH